MEEPTNRNIRDKIIFAAINNIPPDYHSADLRNYFSQFIETRGFDIFHFRHRPELKSSNENQPHKCPPDTRSALCCVVKMKQSKFNELQKMYHRKHWLDSNGESIPRLCFISKIRVHSENEDKVDAYKTRAEQKQIPEDRENFTEADLLKLPELHPPDVMPNGNVGTPTMEFLKLIRECRLPPVVIKKLGLSFPKTRTNKKYGNVPFDYGGGTFSGSNEEEDLEVRSGSGHIICDAADNVIDLDSTDKELNVKSGDSDNHNKINRKWRKDPETKKLMRENIEEKMIKKDNSDSEEDNDSCEEWERHEAMSDDPSNQERNKERLFEEDIELKWEKGGSGLVFYTDAQYWQEQEGDFDEQTTDDLDVDMSAYYEEGAGDKDIKDYITMRQEQRRREGIEDTDRFTAKIAVKRPNKSKQINPETKIGKFEIHTKGIGRKILEEQGWKEGLGLGSSSHGISDALESEGQHGKDKTGFGFRGEKLIKHKLKNRNSQRDVIISTVYDDKKQTDPNEPLLRRHNHYTLKYRDKVEFTKPDSSD